MQFTLEGSEWHRQPSALYPFVCTYSTAAGIAVYDSHDTNHSKKVKQKMLHAYTNIQYCLAVSTAMARGWGLGALLELLYPIVQAKNLCARWI